jgi:hypothetical protein
MRIHFPTEHVDFKAINKLSSHTTRYFIAVSAAVLLLSMGLARPIEAQTWTLQWSDEFNAAAGTSPSSANWTYDLGNSGFGNPEIENYCAPGSNTAPCQASQPNA